MIGVLALLLALQLLGEIIVRTFGLPVPGPVVGMLLLYTGLRLRGELPEVVRETAQGLLNHLPLLFVPAGVGVIVHLALIQSEWLPIALTLLISTLVTMLVTALVMRGLVSLFKRIGGAR